MNLGNFNKAFKLAVENGFNYEYDEIEFSEIQDIYEEAMDLLRDELKPIKLDEGEISGEKNGVSYALPIDGDCRVDGEFAFDRDTETYSHDAQDADGKVYLIEWSLK